MKIVVVMLLMISGFVGHSQEDKWFKSGELTKYRSGNVEISMAFETLIVVMYEEDNTVVSDEEYSVASIALKEVDSDDVYIFDTVDESGFEGQFAYRFDDTEYPVLETILRKLFRSKKEMVFTVIYVRNSDGEYLNKEIRLKSILAEIAGD